MLTRFVKPPIKWAGGKQRLLKDILPEVAKAVSESSGDYYEPFLGSGAIALNLPIGTRVHASDANDDLINLWRTIRDDVDGLVEGLKGVDRDRIAGQRYLELREEYNSSLATHSLRTAVLFAALNRLAHSGLWRVNASGKMNVPSGRYSKPKIIQEENYRKVAARIQSWHIETRRYEAIIPQHGDVLYLDPPYHAIDGKKSFQAYTPEGFPDLEQTRLRDWCVAAKNGGAKVLVSNSDCPEIHDLYKACDRKVIHRPGSINSKTSVRGKVSELLICVG